MRVNVLVEVLTKKRIVYLIQFVHETNGAEMFQNSLLTQQLSQFLVSEYQLSPKRTSDAYVPGEQPDLVALNRTSSMSSW